MGGSQQAYRITVRQLESMIRLSEALTRLHLDDEVRPEYVREAFRLLRTSIIHVEHDDVKLTDLGLAAKRARAKRSKEIFDPEADENTLDENNKNRSNDMESKEPIVMSYEDYQRTLNMLVHRLNEENTGEGLKVGDLIDGYLDVQEDIVDDEVSLS